MAGAACSLGTEGRMAGEVDARAEDEAEAEAGAVAQAAEEACAGLACTMGTEASMACAGAGALGSHRMGGRGQEME